MNNLICKKKKKKQYICTKKIEEQIVEIYRI